MKLFFDQNDLPLAKKLKDDRFHWLTELGAVRLSDAGVEDIGFLFGYHRGEAALRDQVGERPGIHDRPEERVELLALNDVLGKLQDHGVVVPTPRTWVLKIDEPLPADLTFPLFVRTTESSWKRGGKQGKVHTPKELADEAELLRKAFRWDMPIIAREWLEIAPAGDFMFGKAPQEIRTWIIDGTPVAWNFHYLYAVTSPSGFPPSADELQQIKRMAAMVAHPFRSRLMVADFVRDKKGAWHFMEAGPGAVAGTAHVSVFKYVASMMAGQKIELTADAVGGKL